MTVQRLAGTTHLVSYVIFYNGAKTWDILLLTSSVSEELIRIHDGRLDPGKTPLTPASAWIFLTFRFTLREWEGQTKHSHMPELQPIALAHTFNSRGFKYHLKQHVESASTHKLFVFLYLLEEEKKSTNK